MSVRFIECILQNNNLSEEIKKRIILTAGLDINKIKNDPNYVVDDQRVINALENLKKNQQREKFERAMDLVKLNDLITRAESILKELGDKKIRFQKGDDVKIYEFFLSLVDSNISGNIPRKLLGSTVNDYIHMYKQRMSARLNTIARIHDSYTPAQKLDMNRAIVYTLDNKPEKLKGLDSRVLRDVDMFIKALKEADEEKVKLLNENGIIIDPIDNYIGKQTHDEIKLAKDGKEKWIEFTKKLIDPDKTKTPDGTTANEIGVDEYLSRFYDSIILRGNKSEDPFQKGKGKSIIRTEQNHERLMVMKDVESEFIYKQEYGKSDDIVQDLLNGINRDAFNYGLAGVFGSNPESNLQVALNYFSQTMTSAQRKDIEGLFTFSTGESRTYDNFISHNIVKIAKNLKLAGVMGKTFITSYTLDPVAMTKTMKMYGITNDIFPIALFKNYGTIAKNMFNERKKIINSSPEERLAFEKDISSLEGILDRNTTAQRFDGTIDQFTHTTVRGKSLKELESREKWDRAGDISSKLPETLFRITGQTRFQRVAKDLIGQSVLNKMDSYKNKSLEQIKKENPKYWFYLTDTGRMTDADWDKIRGMDEVNYKTISEVDTDLGLKINTMLYDAQSLSIQEASRRVQSIGYKNQKSRDGVSPIVDIVLMLKSFIMQAVPNIFRRYNYAKRQAESLDGYILNGRLNGIREVSEFLIYSMAGAYLTISLKALLNNETPPDEEFLKSPEGLITLLTVSGGLGIIADIVTFDNSSGKSILDAMVGPIGGDVTNVVEGISSFLIEGESNLSSNNIINMVKSYVPFNNMWYSDYITKKLFIERIKEITNKEAFDKAQKYKEKRMRENGQEYLIDF